MGDSPVILVIDLGLTNCKAAAFAADGKVITRSSVPYPTHYPGTGLAEQDPNAWWNAACRAVREAVNAQPDVAERVASISVTGHMHALVSVGRDGQPVSNAIVLGDLRSITSAQYITAEMGLETIYRITGTRMEEAMPAAKLHWLKTHAADIFGAADLFTGCKDFIRGKLTGDRFTDPIDACAMSLYDLQSGTWSEEMMRLVGVTKAVLPDILPPTAQAGTLLPEAAHALGLPSGVPVVVGGGDDIEVVGAGLMTPGCSKEHLGTTGSFLTCIAEPIYDPAMALELYPHAEAGLWVLGGSITSAGAALAWAADVLGYKDVMGVFQEGFDIHPKDTSSRLIFVPHLMGQRCPNWNSQVRGLWAGLSITHSRADLMRAAFNGTAYALNGILRRIDAVVGRQEQVMVTHRPGDSMEWLQFRTNVYGRPVGVLNTSEPTALGAMLLGATGIGVYPNLREAVNNVAGVIHVVEPDADSQSLLARESALYERVQTAMLPIWQAMHTSLEVPDGDSVRSLET